MTTKETLLLVMGSGGTCQLFLGKESFNEWAAVLKHKDELDQETQRHEDQRIRDQKVAYRHSLQNQIKDHLNNRESNNDGLSQKEQWNQERSQIFKEKFSDYNRKLKQSIAAQESIKNAEIKRLHDISSKHTENQILKNQMEHDQVVENERLQTKRAVHLQAQAKLRKTLDSQLAMKNKFQQELKIIDQKVLADGLKNEEKIDTDRNAFLSKLKLEKINLVG